MAEKLSKEELVSFKELLMAQMVQLDTVTQLMIEKGIITEQANLEVLGKVVMPLS